MSRKYREYTYDDWKKAMDLHSKYKLGHIQISRILGISKKTLRKWLYYGVVPPLAKWRAEPFRELGYVIGVLHGDGCVTKDESKCKYIITLDTIDKEFVETFSRAMSRLLNRKYIEPWWDGREGDGE